MMGMVATMEICHRIRRRSLVASADDLASHPPHTGGKQTK